MKKFGESAARLSSGAGQLLGWRPKEFWESTPAELALALEPWAAVETLTFAKLIDLFPDEGLTDAR